MSICNFHLHTFIAPFSLSHKSRQDQINFSRLKARSRANVCKFVSKLYKSNKEIKTLYKIVFSIHCVMAKNLKVTFLCMFFTTVI